MGNFVHGGCVTHGSYFVYKGVRYGSKTIVRFNQQFYDAHQKRYEWNKRKEEFYTIATINGKEVWKCGPFGSGEKYENVDPDKDIYAIVEPYYYYEPRELVEERLRSGTWIVYIGWQTLFYILCLIVSPIFKEWYLIWTIGLFIYLRTSYIALSKP
jgi:hypothetical protein